MAFIGFKSNYFQQVFGRSITFQDDSAGGDFFESASPNGVKPTDNPTTHPLFTVDDNGNIRFYSVQDQGYYFSLITPLYRNKSNFMDWLEASLEPIPYAEWCVALLNNAFDLDQAVGTQLDVLGTIAGVSRNVSFTPTDGSSPTLSDDMYRKLIKCKIAKNQWDGKIESLQPVWQEVEPGAKIMLVDNQDMTMTVSVFGTLDSTFKDLIDNGYIVPKTQTVRINAMLYAVNTALESFSLPAFGFGMDTDEVSGFDKGTWVMNNGWSGPPTFGFDQDDSEISGFAVGTWFVPAYLSYFGFDQEDTEVSGFAQGTWKITP